MEKVNKERTEYFKEIDVIRCIAIFLVVFGHSFPDASSAEGISNHFWRYVFNFIYSFHMPLFFALSGFVSIKFPQTVKEKSIHIKKRLTRLLIPYLVWAFIYVPFKILLSRYTSAPFEIKNLWRIILGDSPYSGLWFLYALFIIDTICILIINSKITEMTLLGFSFLLLIVAKCRVIGEPVRWIFAFMFYFILGHIIREYHSSFIRIVKKKLVVMLSTCGVVFLSYYDNNTSSFHGITSIFAALCGIVMLFGFGDLLKDRHMLSYIGKYSMDIYIFSGIFLVIFRIILYNMMRMNYSVYVIVSTIISFFAPIYLSKNIIRKNKYLSILLIGLQSKN